MKSHPCKCEDNQAQVVENHIFATWRGDGVVRNLAQQQEHCNAQSSSKEGSFARWSAWRKIFKKNRTTESFYSRPEKFSIYTYRSSGCIWGSSGFDGCLRYVWPVFADGRLDSVRSGCSGAASWDLWPGFGSQGNLLSCKCLPCNASCTPKCQCWEITWSSNWFCWNSSLFPSFSGHQPCRTSSGILSFLAQSTRWAGERPDAWTDTCSCWKGYIYQTKRQSKPVKAVIVSK